MSIKRSRISREMDALAKKLANEITTDETPTVEWQKVVNEIADALEDAIDNYVADHQPEVR